MSTPSMRVCTVDVNEDFTIMLVDDESLSTLDAAIVPCGTQSDASVRIVSNESEATEFVFAVSEGTFENTFTEEF